MVHVNQYVTDCGHIHVLLAGGRGGLYLIGLVRKQGESGEVVANVAS